MSYIEHPDFPRSPDLLAAAVDVAERAIRYNSELIRQNADLRDRLAKTPSGKGTKRAGRRAAVARVHDEGSPTDA